jgi:hypothetical protein
MVDDPLCPSKLVCEGSMKNHMPPVPPANRNDKFPGNNQKPQQDTTPKHPEPENLAEQGHTANIKQNTTNAGFFHGRRVK